VAAGLCLVASASPAPGRSAAAGPRTPAATAPRFVPFERGLTVGEWGPTAYQPDATRATLTRLAHGSHVGSVTLFVVWADPEATASTVAPGHLTAPTQNLVLAIRAAKALNLEVILRPYLEVADGSWRGDIHPQSVNAWFRSYDDFILRYASLAQREHVDGFVVGSELKSMSTYAGAWRSLVRQVRSRFKGFVTYQANFDEYQGVTWWGALDLIDISAYFPLAKTPQYTIDELVAGWVPWREQLRAVQRLFGLPVIFGEIGYRTVTGQAQRPWDVTLSGPTDLADQARAYGAAFRVWYRVPWFRGFQWWYVSPQQKLVAGFTGAEQRPAAQALAVVSRWYERSP
jgi:hypothetical protein